MKNSPACPQPRQVRSFWAQLVSQAIQQGASTPFYLFSTMPVANALKSLAIVENRVPVPVRHWFPVKAQPLAPLLKWWHAQHRPVEVSSEYELLAARETGFSPNDILVNGPAKSWLCRHTNMRGLRVNIDSASELKELVPIAKPRHWNFGVRCLTSQEVDPHHQSRPTQFGLEPTQAVTVIRELLAAGANLDT
ncbi:MAG: hypothetical protein N3G20_02250, partial [Verrucomicrobiae bacterium]|nr:hypothetical protein [Verrucomicrobiae bacterium]